VEYADVVRRRRMVRNYDPDRPVPPGVVDRLLGYAVRAPSAGFSQGWGFLILDEPADLATFWTASTPEAMTGSSWLAGMRNAPLIVVALSNMDTYLARYAEADKGWSDRAEWRWPVPYWHIDAGFASLLVLLGAVDEGLGACFFGIPGDHTRKFRQAFGVPDEYTPIGAITIGYRAADRRSPSLRRGRREVREVAHRGRWGSGYANCSGDSPD
jgi:nitroreductase